MPFGSQMNNWNKWVKPSLVSRGRVWLLHQANSNMAECFFSPLEKPRASAVLVMHSSLPSINSYKEKQPNVVKHNDWFSKWAGKTTGLILPSILWVYGKDTWGFKPANTNADVISLNRLDAAWSQTLPNMQIKKERNGKMQSHESSRMENRKSETIWVKDDRQLLFSKFAFAHTSSRAPPASSPHFTVYLAVISIFLQQPAAEQPQHLHSHNAKSQI